MYYLDFHPNYFVRFLKNNLMCLIMVRSAKNNYFWMRTKLGHLYDTSLLFTSVFILGWGIKFPQELELITGPVIVNSFGFCVCCPVISGQR